MRKNIRQHIVEHINNHIGWRLGNIERGTANATDKDLVSEALGFRSLALFSVLSDEELRRAWDNSNLEYSL